MLPISKAEDSTTVSKLVNRASTLALQKWPSPEARVVVKMGIACAKRVEIRWLWAKSQSQDSPSQVIAYSNCSICPRVVKYSQLLFRAHYSKTLGRSVAYYLFALNCDFQFIKKL